MSITYKQAIMSEDKDRESYVSYTYVKWEKDIEVPQKVKLNTLRETEMIIAPKLPCGYKMEYHPSWDEVIERIYDPSKTYPFEYLDKVCLDMDLIKDLTGYDIVNDVKQEGYFEYDQSFDKAWWVAKTLIEKLSEKAIGKKPPSNRKNLNRTMPPPIKQIINNLAKLLEDKELIESIVKELEQEEYE